MRKNKQARNATKTNKTVSHIDLIIQCEDTNNQLRKEGNLTLALR